MLFSNDYTEYLPVEGEAHDVDRFRLLLLISCGPPAVKATLKRDCKDVPALVRQAKRELSAAGVSVTKAKVKAAVRRMLVELHNKRADELVDRIKAKSGGHVITGAK